ncbi:cupin-like domain-containing protein [Thalassotalea marina]|uniref:Cupin n=1 Tax=Thalassotalea marina TaxID=1673741 RepID=A0A919BR06_9GAMM|nr:cupin-like domain-containing protein [Thalassotalea marina]GHG06744.1 cupin [Thalassotalea marina]
MTSFLSIDEYTNVCADKFYNEVVPAQKPIVIRGFATHWPLVQTGKSSPEEWVQYINQFYNGNKTNMVVAPPYENKRFYYNHDLTGVNFLSGEERVDLFLGRLLELIDRDVYPAISMQGTPIESILPELMKDNPTEFFTDVQPRLWIGNEGIVNTHYDGSDNVACVVAGRRQFILFPPDQTKNLYPGPLNFTPAGAPTSLVDINNPDFERYPLFEEALDHAYFAELAPGDAIFIPMLWWHHVESLDKVNALINYWWNGASAVNAVAPSAIDSLNIALLAMRNLNLEQRNSWRHLFDHYLFKQGVEPTSYIPEHQQHLLGNLSDDYVEKVRQYFANKLSQ